MNQESIEYFSKRVEELIDGIDKGDFSKEIIPDDYRWEHLLGLLLLKDSLDGGEDLYIHLYRKAISSAEKYIHEKARRGEKIMVAFHSCSAAQWPAGVIYREYESTTSFDARVIVSPCIDRGKDAAINNYVQTYRFFQNNGYKTYGGMDVQTCKMASWKEMGGIPDVLYETTSWFTSMPESQWFSLLPLRCLVAYIPYGLYLADNADGSYAREAVYNKEIVNLMWRVYCDSKYNHAGYQKYQLLKGENVRLSGYVKMDYFSESREWSEQEVSLLWKTDKSSNISRVKRIIIAPHYSVGNTGVILFSTFKKNAWFFLYLAKKYKEIVSFVFKPHPNLRAEAVREGVFKDFDEYDEYLNKWNELPNARVVQESGYLEYFDTSDAMIMDSGSFLGEYLYTGKPLLFLTRPEQRFMENGKRILEAYYKTPGENYQSIEEFIENVVINGKDYLQQERKRVFSEEYDYYKTNGIKAREYICRDLYTVMN